MGKIGQLQTSKSIDVATREIREWLDRLGINGMAVDLRYDAKTNIALCKFKYKNKDYEFRSTKQNNCRLNMHGIARVMEGKVRFHIMGIEDFEKSMSAYLQLPNYSEFKDNEFYEADKECYKVLEINSLASNEELIKQHKKLCKTYHPDMANSEEAKEMMEKKISKINEAWSEIKKERGI